jgi:hypothetical protein
MQDFVLETRTYLIGALRFNLKGDRFMTKTTMKLVNFETIYCSSNSIIYKAFNTETNTKVIIKTLNRELYDSKSLS